MSVYIISYTVITILFIILANNNFRILKLPIIKDASYNVRVYRKQMKLFVIVSCAVLIGVIGLRSEYQGIDLHNSLGTGYFYVYDIVCGDSVADIFRYFSVKRYANFEIGYVLFNKFISVLCSNQQILLFATSVLSIIPVGYYIYKNSRNLWLSFMIYMSLPFFTAAYFSAIRQGIAIGIFVFSFEMIKRKKFFWFIILAAIALSFHKSAIVCFVAYPIYHLRIRKKDALLAGISLLVLVYITKVPLFTVLSKVIKSNAQLDDNGAINYFLFLLVIFMLCACFCNEDDREMCGLRNLFWLGCASQAFAGLFSTAGRVTWYFLPALMVLIPNLLAEAKIKEKSLMKLLEWGIGILAIILGLYYLRYDPIAVAYPYVPFWLQESI